MTSETPAAGGGGDNALRRLIPRVERQVERPPMDGEQQLPLDERARPHGLFGGEMNVGPGVVVRSDLDERDVERSVAPPVFGDAVERAGVAAVKNAMRRAR